MRFYEIRWRLGYLSKRTIKGKTVRVKQNALLSSFWKNKRHFADLFNTYLFDGRQVIDPEYLEEQDTSYSELIVGNRLIESIERIRDITKMTALGTEFILLGIENQNKVHYAMPLRTMVYDALGYVKQCKELRDLLNLQRRQDSNSKQSEISKAKTNSEQNVNQELTADEFLSKFRKTDRLIAQYTIVIYYGEDDWDGPRSLKEMLNIPLELEPLVQDYKMNLLEARKVDYSKFHNADVSGFFQLMHASNNKDNILENVLDLQFSNETLLVAGKVCNVKEWMDLALESKEEVICMSTAWQEAKKELIERGRQEGRMEVETEKRKKWERKAERKGERKGEIKALVNLYKKQLVNLEDALCELNMKEEEFLQLIR